MPRHTVAVLQANAYTHAQHKAVTQQQASFNHARTLNATFLQV
jgi:hypothetical protein